MTDIVVKATSDDVGLRRESSVDAVGVPAWLARLHQSLPAGVQLRLSVEGDLPLPREVLFEGAGFREQGSNFVREATLPDVVGPNMRAVVCGLNPSLHAAEAGVGFVSPSNRFWPAAIAAGVVTNDRKPFDALLEHGIGFTDLVKRATTRADEVTKAEFAAGYSRIERLVGWLRPERLVMVGVTGWRAATGDTSAKAGWLATSIGDTPVYLMPNPSGLNAHATLETLTDHLRTALGPVPASA